MNFSQGNLVCVTPTPPTETSEYSQEGHQTTKVLEHQRINTESIHLVHYLNKLFLLSPAHKVDPRREQEVA